jgi:phage-related protein
MVIRFDVKYLPGAITFLESIEIKAAEKLIFNISKSQAVNDPRIFKKLRNSNIWEFRAEYNSIEYRLFAFWDKRQNVFVICTHGIIKKTQKTPKREIEKAEQIRKKYLEL